MNEREVYFTGHGDAKLCYNPNEPMSSLTNPVEKKLYAIFYKEFFFGDQYNAYVKFVDTYDVFHDVGELIYFAPTEVRNIRWCELSDESIEEAVHRYEKDGLWERIGKNKMKRTEKLRNET